MPLSNAHNRLYTRSSQLIGQTADGLDIDGLDDIGEAIADADLFIIDNGGGGTNTKTAVTRIPTYTFSKISGAITVNSSGVASYPTTVEATNLTLSGNLTVNGSTVTVNSSTVTIDDPMFALADNNSADTVDIGWYGKYVDSGTKYSGLFRDASDSDMWKLFATTGNSDAAPSTTVDTTSGFTLANLSVNELTGTIATASQANITTLAGLTTIGTVSNALTMTYSDVTLFHDANNADTSFSIGTSATEALKIEVLNGSSNKTAEEIHFSTATASGTANHGKMVFDVDGTDIVTIDDGGIDLGSGLTFSINGSDISTTDTTYSAGTLLDLSSTTFNVDLTEAGEAAIANGDYILFLDGGATGSHAKEAIADVATLFAGTGLTATNSVIAVDSSQAITALTGGDLTIYEDANNADVSLKLGTSATESLSIEVLNGSSNKTAEEIHFSTATASGTANHGKMVFDIDGTDQMEINDSGVSITGDLTITGDDLFMNTNTAGHILVGEDTNNNQVAVSGDVTLSSSGAVTIANDAVESGMLNDNVISGQTEISSGLADADELLYSDGGTLKKVGLDTLTTHINSTAASKGFATAMAIAL